MHKEFGIKEDYTKFLWIVNATSISNRLPNVIKKSGLAKLKTLEDKFYSFMLNMIA